MPNHATICIISCNNCYHFMQSFVPFLPPLFVKTKWRIEDNKCCLMDNDGVEICIS